MREVQRLGGSPSRNPHEGFMGLLDAMQANYPGLSGNVPEATTPLGEPRTQGASGLARAIPLRYDIERDEPTLKLLREADVGVPDAPKSLNYGSMHIDLTETEQDTLKRARGAAIRDYLGAFANDPQFQALSVVERNTYLRRMVSSAATQANKQFLFDLPDDQLTGRLKEKTVPEPYYLGGAA
jgi:hypothetical protein